MNKNNLKLLPYSTASKGAKRLAEALDIERLKRDGGKVDVTKLYLNWGNSPTNVPDAFPPTTSWINSPKDVEKSVDKLLTFTCLQEHNVPTLDWFTSRDEVDAFLADSPWIETVVSRHNPRGMRGKEISYTEVDSMEGSAYPDAPLYTMLYEHEAEVRVHVIFGQIAEIHDKTAHGFIGKETGKVYTLDEAMLSSTAIEAVAALSLDVAAVDLLWSDGKCVVLEVNTAPEMKDGTLEAYVRAFEQQLHLNIPEEETPMKTSKVSKTSAKSSELAPQERVDAVLAATATAEDPTSGKASAKTSPEAAVIPVAKTSTKTSAVVAGKASEASDYPSLKDLEFTPEEMLALPDDIVDESCKDCADDSFPMIEQPVKDSDTPEAVCQVLSRSQAIEVAIAVLEAETDVLLDKIEALQLAINVLTQ